MIQFNVSVDTSQIILKMRISRKMNMLRPLTLLLTLHSYVREIIQHLYIAVAKTTTVHTRLPSHVTKMAVTPFDPPLPKTPCCTQTLWLYLL